jgi:hypothetical protein
MRHDHCAIEVEGALGGADTFVEPSRLRDG